MYAIIETGGKQFRVAQGDVVRVEKLDAEVGADVTFDRVLLVANDDSINIGTPIVAGAKVVAKVLAQDKAKKIEGFKYKSKKNYRRRWGHRQPYTKVQIEAIEA